MPVITSLDQLDLTKKYTYSDYLSWQFQEHVELIKGRIFKMSPGPNRKHQEVSRNLLHFMGNFLWQKKCKIYHPPFDVRLIKNGNDTVVQPDICVICDLDKLTNQGCKGAPNLIIEILSPGNSRKELKDKFRLYEENEVQEYWIVYPTEESLIVYTLDKEGKYIGSNPFVAEDVVHSTVLKGFSVTIDEIFDV